ncbi:methyltransferase domain-containing protein [Sorangium sp. So ce1024]|uniref:methyltransferase domain-containing protein n=1 Tax=unclassified Sorangium TaxID=2621164 RepID=UPI003F0A7EF9
MLELNLLPADAAPTRELTDDEVALLREDLHYGPVDDGVFDALYAAPIRARSQRYWTTTDVARQAASLFARHNARRVLDIGSGPGKFCLVAACARPDIEFTGVEHRAHLVDAARAAAQRLGLPNVRFIRADATDPAWFGFDGFYLYNPFAENLYSVADHFDDTVELSRRRFMDDVGRVIRSLARVATGTCVVTYNGFGGPIPSTFELVHAERAGCDWLRLWVKRHEEASPEDFYLEEDDGVTLVRGALPELKERLAALL